MDDARTMRDGADPGEVAALMQRVLYEVKKVVVGQDHFLERVLVAVLARGHLLVEGVPGLAKTLTVKTLARALQGDFKRIQFTPDLMPADIVGTRLYNQKSGEFSVSLGPVFTHLLLADEINRAPAKVQSALLEVMQERQVTIGKQTYQVPNPFLVMATQNPIESDGTYPLPEAQLDRFMFKVLVDYPSYEDEIVVVDRITGPAINLRTLITPQHLLGLQQVVDRIYVDPHVTAYAATLVNATRKLRESGLEGWAPAVAFGASPRASINLITAARALAFIRQRSYVLPYDVADLAPDVMRHRIVLTYDGIANGVTADSIVKAVLQRFQPPRIDLGDKHVA